MAKVESPSSKVRQGIGELEALSSIIKDHPFLLDQVLTHIKEHRNTKKQGINELVSAKKDAAKQQDRERGSGS